MRKVLVFGNSGSGKSTLAKSLCGREGLAHFDLDTIAWKPTDPNASIEKFERAPIEQCREKIDRFTREHDAWVIEGCYATLMELAAAAATEIIYLNLDFEDCVKNARRRPWEPHKYATRELQDANLEILIEWIRAYPHREDDCAYAAHRAFYDQFTGKKTMIRDNGHSG